MAPLKLALDPYYKGDTWKGFTINSILIDGLAPAANAVSCKMQFRSKAGELGFEYNTDTSNCKGLITIDDAALWVITVKPEILPLDKGIWWWDFEVVDAEGTLLTILTGRLRVTQDITQR
jgi:hypothetical protein